MTPPTVGDTVWLECQVTEAYRVPGVLRLLPVLSDGTLATIGFSNPERYRWQAGRRVPPAEAYQDLLNEIARLKAEVERLRGHVALPHQRSASFPKGWLFEPPHPDDGFWGEWFHEDCPAVAGPGQDELLGCVAVNSKLVLCRDCGQKVELEPRSTS